MDWKQLVTEHLRSKAIDVCIRLNNMELLKELLTKEYKYPKYLLRIAIIRSNPELAALAISVFNFTSNTLAVAIQQLIKRLERGEISYHTFIAIGELLCKKFVPTKARIQTLIKLENTQLFVNTLLTNIDIARKSEAYLIANIKDIKTHKQLLEHNFYVKYKDLAIKLSNQAPLDDKDIKTLIKFNVQANLSSPVFFKYIDRIVLALNQFDWNSLISPTIYGQMDFEHRKALFDLIVTKNLDSTRLKTVLESMPTSYYTIDFLFLEWKGKCFHQRVDIMEYINWYSRYFRTISPKIIQKLAYIYPQLHNRGTTYYTVRRQSFDVS
jgi:hypothetical protein